MKRLLTLLLAITLVLAMPTSVLAEDAPVTITIFGVGTTVPEDNVIIPALEKALGIKIKLENMTADTAALVTRVSGGDIPDVFKMSSTNLVSTLYESDVLLNVRDYLDRMPHLYELFGDDMTYWGQVCFDDGYYAIPKRSAVNYSSWYMRLDWLEALGKTMPTNFDELFEICVAMRDADFDGNGKADTYAISGHGIGFGDSNCRGAFNPFFTAYGVSCPGTLMIIDGEPVYACTTENFKKAVEEIRRFVDADLVDPEIVSNTTNATLEKAASGRIGFAYTGWTEFGKPEQIDILKSIYPEAKWGHVDAISTPYGQSGASVTASRYTSCFGLSADLADEPQKLDAVLRLFDYISYGEGDMLMCYGIEGVHYNIVDDKVVKTDAMNDLGYAWALQMLYRNDMEYMLVKFSECEDEIRYAAEEIPMILRYGSFVKTPDTMNLADLKTYEEEQLTQFIFNDRSMDEWDSFIQTLYDSFGLGLYIDAAKTQLTEMGIIK